MIDKTKLNIALPQLKIPYIFTFSCSLKRSRLRLVYKVKKAIEEYKTNNLRRFSDGYGGEENATAVADSILESVGDYVYFIATNNAKDIESKILEMI